MKKDLSIMIKPASSICNMRCKYCFYHSLAQSREAESYGIMTHSTAENLIKKALAFCEGGSIYFAFQGGEPLFAGKEFFKDFVSTVDKYNTQGCKVYYNLQTNGTLIDGEWADFFAKNKFLLGLSLDGDQDANRFRLDSNLNYTFPKVEAAMDLLKEHGVDFNVLIVATGYTADHIEAVYKYFKSQDIKYLQFIPCLRPFGDKSESELYMTVEQYSSFLIKLFNLYVKDYVKGEYVSIRQLDNYVRLFLGGHAEQCGMNGVCSRQFVVEGNGNVYPCDFYCLDEWLLGNVNSEDFTQLAFCKKAEDFTRGSFNIPTQCRNCPYFRVCRGGGCKRSKEDRDYCQAYKKFFSACLPLFRVFINEKK
ncbi:MAG: radical SAM protein [Clostridia bacterium]|nr:radical SAM protein [Clostridia bacterium]